MSTKEKNSIVNMSPEAYLQRYLIKQSQNKIKEYNEESSRSIQAIEKIENRQR